MNTFTMDLKRLVEAHGDWLKETEWEWFATLTFRNKVTSKQAHVIWKKWLLSLEMTMGGRVVYVRTMERQTFRDNPHYHVLIMGVQGELPRKWEREWHHIGGIARIEKYDPSRGAAYYISKFIGGECEDIIYSKWLK